MAGLREELELDISAALGRINTVEQALTASATSFRVELARSLETLRTVDVDVDTAGIAAQVSGAIEGVDGQLSLDFDTGGIAQKISDAVDAADTNVVVDADATDVREVAREVDNVGENAKKSKREVSELEQNLRKLVTVGVAIKGVQFLAESVDIASNLSEQISASEVIFGRAQQEVLNFARTAATSIGEARDEALELTNSLGGLLVGLGITEQEAARLGPTLIQRAADIASLRNVAGGASEVLEKFQSALVGEAEPVRPFGVIINEAAVAAKALELGLGGVGRELTEVEKVQARYALILEGTSVAQGNFALTADGLANKQRTVNALWREARGAIGEAFLPVADDLVESFRDDLIPVLQELGERAGPVARELLEALGPAARSGLVILEGLVPVLTVVAETLDAIPEPLLSTIASFGAMRSILGPLNGLLGTTGGQLGGVAGRLAGINPIAAGATVGLTALVTAIGAHSRSRAEERRRIEEVTRALEDNTKSIESNLAAIVETKFAEFNEVLATAGVNTDQLTAAIAAGGDEFDRYAAKIRGDLGPTIDSADGSALQLEMDLKDLRDEIIAGAEAAVTNKVATGEMSSAYADVAVAAATSRDGQVNWVRALENAEEQQRATLGELNRFRTGMDLARGSVQATIPVFQTAGEEAELFEIALNDLLEPMLAIENQSINAAEAVINFSKMMAEGRRENETQEEFMLRVAGSTNSLIQAQLDASQSSREAADRLAELGQRFPEVQGKVEALIAQLAFAGEEIGPAGRMIAQSFINGIVEGLRDDEGRITQSADTVARIIEDRVSRRLEVQSPSRVGVRLGAQFIAGIALGLENLAPVTLAIARLDAALVRPLEPVVLATTPLPAAAAQGTQAATPSNVDRGIAAAAQVQIGPNYNVELDPGRVRSALEFVS